jgi:hypothetical protein
MRDEIRNNMRDEIREALSEPQMEMEVKEYRPSKSDCLREYEINIRFLSRGCIVRVGCKEIAFEDVSKAMAEINEYVTGDTYEIQKKWRKLLDM